MTFEMHVCFIHVKGDTKHPNEWKYKVRPHKKRLHFPNWDFFRWRPNQVFLGKQIMHWSSCDRGFNLYLMNCRWNYIRVNFPRAVDWISFILVVMKRVHGICKDPHADGSPVDWRFWSPDNTHHCVLSLQAMPLYFSTVPISERVAFILPCMFFIMVSNISA